jgi:hypothetical protein
MVTRLIGGLTPGDGADPRTFPAIFNDAADDIEALQDLNPVQFGTAVGSAVTGDQFVYDGTNWVNGPRSHNAIINGDFGIWQRGAGPFTTTGYSADRWSTSLSGASISISREAFTPADIEAIGYGDAEHFLRFDVTTGNDFVRLQNRIEDVRTLSGQKVTLSFWAKGTNPGGGNVKTGYNQNFGSGGSADVANYQFSNVVLTASWQRFSVTFDVPSVSGKTIGSGSYFEILLGQGSDTSTDAWNLDVWGVQFEAGSVATPFRLAGGGSKAAELALCQRYYQKISGAGSTTSFVVTNGTIHGSTEFRGVLSFSSMRSVPSISFSGTFDCIAGGSGVDVSSFTPGTIGGNSSRILATLGASRTVGHGAYITASADGNAFYELNSEL